MAAFPGPRPALAQEPVLAPLLFRLEGVGPIYGAAGGAGHWIGGRGGLFAAVTGGGVEAQGLVLSGVPVGSGAAVHAFALNLTRAGLDTSYTRGTAKDRPVRLEVSGLAWGGAVSFGAGERGLQAIMAAGQSSISFEGFETLSGSGIDLPNAHLLDVETTHAVFDLSWAGMDRGRDSRRGVFAGGRLWSQSGRTGQSDVLEASLRATGVLPLGGRTVLAFHLRAHDAHVLDAEDAYDTEAEAAEALGIQCGSVPGGNDQTRCETLAEDIAEYIAAHNRYGTVTPLGGSTSLRAYREFRFRAAHTRLAAAEARVRLLRWLDGVAFAERGYAADAPAELYEEARDSYGLGLRAWVKGVPVRLETARGDEGDAWFLTAGLPW